MEVRRRGGPYCKFLHGPSSALRGNPTIFHPPPVLWPQPPSHCRTLFHGHAVANSCTPPPPACHGLILPLACVLLCFYFTAEDAPEDAQTFWRTVDQAVLEPAECGGHFLDLKTCNWLGMAKSLNHIMYVRECYPELWNYIKNNPEKHRFGILGKPMFFF